MDRGWIKLHRKIKNNDAMFRSAHTFTVFCLLLLMADEHGRIRTGRYQLAERLKIKPTVVYQTLIRLRNMTTIELQSDNKGTTIQICKWSTYQEKSDTKVTTKPLQNDTIQEAKKLRIEKQDNTNTTDVVLAEPEIFGKPEINEVFEYWHISVGYALSSKQQANRRAASNLIKKHGTAKLHQLIDGVALAANDKYAPRVSDFCDLQSKFNELILWGQKRRGQGSGIVVIR